MTYAKALLQVAMNERDMKTYDWIVNTSALFLGDFGFHSLPGDRISSAQTNT
jgi:hypothetical protein